MLTHYYSQRDVSQHARLAKLAVRRRIARLIEFLYPHGTRDGDVWLIGDKYGNPGQNLRIRLAGRGAGNGYDQTTRETIDVITMWRAVFDVSFFTAAQSLCRWRAPRKPRRGRPADHSELGESSPSSPPPSDAHQPDPQHGVVQSPFIPPQ